MLNLFCGLFHLLYHESLKKLLFIIIFFFTYKHQRLCKDLCSHISTKPFFPLDVVGGIKSTKCWNTQRFLSCCFGFGWKHLKWMGFGSWLSRRVRLQVPDGFRRSRVDQPHTGGQTGAGSRPQTPRPVQRTHSAQSGQEELLHHQVARSLRLHRPPQCLYAVKDLQAR